MTAKNLKIRGNKGGSSDKSLPCVVEAEEFTEDSKPGVAGRRSLGAGIPKEELGELLGEWKKNVLGKVRRILFVIGWFKVRHSNLCG
jgi:hypothetical protein